MYSEKETRVDKDEILQNIEKVTKINNEDASRLECKITEGEVAVTLLHTKNNVAPGPGGFGGGLQDVLEVLQVGGNGCYWGNI